MINILHSLNRWKTRLASRRSLNLENSQRFELLPSSGQKASESGFSEIMSTETPAQSLLPKNQRHVSSSSFGVFRISGWFWETLSLVGSTLSLVALICVLRVYENKRSPQWSLGMSLNTVISIVSTTFKSSMMMSIASSVSQAGWIWLAQRPKPLRDICWYDEASRGPLGSLQLLLRLKLQHTVCLGAFVTLMALGLDPFFQQTIKYESRALVVPELKAQTSVAYGYNGFMGAMHELSNAYVYLPYDMRAAMYGGLISLNQWDLPTPPFSCPSGNCTWEPFSTLSINTICEDMTPKVSLNCTSPGPNTDIPYGACNFQSRDDELMEAMLNGTTPNNFFIVSPYMVRDALPAIKRYRNITGFLIMVQWAKVTDLVTTLEDQGSEKIRPTMPYEAGRCIFYLSVKQFQARVDNGIYTEKLLDEYLHVSNATQRPTYTYDDTEYFIRDPWNWEEDLVFNAPFELDRNFTVGYRSFDSIISAFWGDNFLMGNVSMSSAARFQGDPIAIMLLKADNVTRAMHNMAHYMTISLRSNSTLLLQNKLQNASAIAPEQVVQGQVWQQAQFVTVRWIWLALPCATILLAFVFLGVVIVGTRNRPVGIWKSSPLTLFFQCKLAESWERHASLDNEALNTVDSMEKTAAKLNASAMGGDDLGVRISAR
ncbi:hypothetical protein K469DRAFT_748002 [Zopfia rhizophila CBS 207.26]|uniref:Uncharacterized protein n=1 Tax=Zopfia rhizophila CBS 207.26 TaxID=1314779 RepID=A0A6A6EDL3_9PEZI|nr:hypothetical protein K469DRAFT_748002 [Zopfia rhizophila CBS 207.26]